MSTGEMRQQLHHYIDVADDRNISAIYTILEERLQAGNGLSEQDIAGFYERRNEYLSGNTRTYSVEEAHAIIRNSREK